MDIVHTMTIDKILYLEELIKVYEEDHSSVNRDLAVIKLLKTIIEEAKQEVNESLELIRSQSFLVNFKESGSWMGSVNFSTNHASF